MFAVLERATLAVIVGTVAFMPATRAEAQVVQVRGGFVGFGTGDEVNCPVGMGVAGGVELRTTGSVYAGIGADLYVATPQVCTTASRIIAYDGGLADEFAGVTLLFAPRLSGRLGSRLEAGNTRLDASLVGGLIQAAELWGDGARRVLPYAGGAVTVKPLAWSFALLLEHGYQRVPVTHQIREQERWRMVHEYGRWKPLFNIGVSVVR
jgi:hypothetical protein